MKLSRRLAVLPVAAGLIAGPVLAAAPAFAAGHAKAHATTHVKAHATKSHVRRTPFTAVGTVAAVDPTAGTVTVTVKSATRDLRGKTLPATVTPTTKVVLNDVVVTLADVPVGAHVVVVGTRAGTALTATKVIASTS